jgi:hypothetical protein
VRYALRPVVALSLALAAGAVEATAVETKLSEATVRARLVDVDVRPSANRPGWLTLGTWRAPELQLQEAGFQLVMVWNGLDDDKWPATRIGEVLAAEICGPVRHGAMEGFLARLYRSPSLVPEISQGDNAGPSFKKRLKERLGTCQVEMLAEGARWHTLTVTVRR